MLGTRRRSRVALTAVALAVNQGTGQWGIAYNAPAMCSG